MSGIINPESGLPFEQERLLSELMVWTTAPSILRALAEQRVLTPKQSLSLAYLIKQTTDKNAVGTKLSAKTTAGYVYHILSNRVVRQQIAKHLEGLHSDVDKTQIMSDLSDLHAYLEKEYGLGPKPKDLLVG